MSGFFTISVDGVQDLKSRWLALTGCYCADEALKECAFAQLSSAYDAKGRAYHNLSHIKALLDHVEGLRAQITDLDAVHFAVWFHDVIYYTRKTDNEEKSAELAERVMTELGVPAARIAASYEMIIATKRHNADKVGTDGSYFLDADLAILGAPADIYEHYRRAIREEYSWVPDFLYKSSRGKILKNFLSRERIYFTEEMAARYESQARVNLTQEIDSL